MNLEFFIEKHKHSIKSFLEPYPWNPKMIERKYLFIHVPKTAGTSILHAMELERYDRIHLNWRVYEQSNRFFFNTFFKFAVVRHPLDRISSVYNYLIQGGGNQDLRLSNHLNKKAPSFEKFILDYLTPSKIMLHNLFRSQSFFLCDESGTIKVDYILKFETLDKDFQLVSDKIGFSIKKLPVKNMSKNLINKVSFEAKEKIRYLYEDDFYIFNYE